jgi:hypothetical protein
MRTEDLIVDLARSAGAVRPLPSPLVRMAQWAAGGVVVCAIGVLAIHPRTDLATVIVDPQFGGVLIATLVTACVAAAAAFILSVPGAERSPLQRVVPFVAGGVWAVMLVDSLRARGNAVERLLALPLHAACIAEIVGLGAVLAWVLFNMLRRAAPIDRTWCAALATLAAVALSAAATQIICPIDDPAHQLIGHFAPVAVLVILGAVAGRGRLEWSSGRPRATTSASPA